MENFYFREKGLLQAFKHGCKFIKISIQDQIFGELVLVVEKRNDSAGDFAVIKIPEELKNEVNETLGYFFDRLCKHINLGTFKVFKQKVINDYPKMDLRINQENGNLAFFVTKNDKNEWIWKVGFNNFKLTIINSDELFEGAEITLEIVNSETVLLTVLNIDFQMQKLKTITDFMVRITETLSGE